MDEMFNGLFTCGGDITAAVCKRFSTNGLIPKKEIYPLVVHGEFIDGNGNLVNLVTKGGMVGQDDTMEISVDFLTKIMIHKEKK